MKLTKEDIEKVAWLARLELANDEKESLTGHLNEIISHFSTLQELDTDQVEPTSHSIPVVNVFRDDVSKSSLPVCDAILNAPEEHDNYFVVPQVVEI
ncbi:MAG: Asp-tRNA(Asn)/Glu-tRNA(Gln) amidotransferase subunit GatC [Armatimonadota bacterium]